MKNKNWKDFNKIEKTIVVGVLLILAHSVTSQVSSYLRFEAADRSQVREMSVAKRTSHAGEPSSPVVSSVVEKPRKFDTSVLPDFCQPKDHVELTQKMYYHCVKEGMSYYQIGNMIGHPGEQLASSGRVETWSWGGSSDSGGGGLMSVVFIDGKMTSKAQSGLPNNYEDW